MDKASKKFLDGFAPQWHQAPHGFGKLWLEARSVRTQPPRSAFMAYLQALRHAAPETILESYRQHRKYVWRQRPKDKIPHLSTWLNDGGYDAVIVKPAWVQAQESETIRMSSRAEQERRDVEAIEKEKRDIDRIYHAIDPAERDRIERVVMEGLKPWQLRAPGIKNKSGGAWRMLVVSKAREIGCTAATTSN